MFNEEMTEIAQVIWESVLQLPLQPDDSASPVEVASAVTAAIQISGGWTGVVTVSLNPALGKRVASAMLAIGTAQLDDSDVAEALLELVNMLAGNLKALLPPPCALALPRIVAPATLAGEAAEDVLRFSCLDQSVEIRVRPSSVGANVTSEAVVC